MSARQTHRACKINGIKALGFSLLESDSDPASHAHPFKTKENKNGTDFLPLIRAELIRSGLSKVSPKVCL
jgi:hypothetical protein